MSGAICLAGENRGGGASTRRGAAGTDAIIGYLEKLRRQDGGFAWENQPRSHLTPTYAAIGCHSLLGRWPVNEQALVGFVREDNPVRGRRLEHELHLFEFQQIQSLRWMGADASALKPIVAKWKRPQDYMKAYERDGNPVFAQEIVAFLCRQLLGMNMDDLKPAFVDFLMARQRKNGSFNNVPAADGGDGHVVNTYWGLLGLGTLGASPQFRDLPAWLAACQLPNGGFTYRPKAEIGAMDDVAYTHAALRCMKLTGAEIGTTLRQKAIEYLCSLWNGDGGFGDRPGWPSNPVATYYAVDALDAAGAVEELAGKTPRAGVPVAASAIPENLNVYTIQIEAPGKGSPADAVEMARSLGIHLWGAKNAAPGWIRACQAVADREKVAVTFFVANEEYGTYLKLPGLGTYSHISDLIAPAGRDFGPQPKKPGGLTWAQFIQDRVMPLEKAGGRLVWQFGENEAYVRVALDESVEKGGFAAISTFHFGNPDFTDSEPFLYRWRHLLPLVALQDAHANESWWWGDQLAGFRTVFLAREPTWEAWLEAMKRNWVMAIRHDEKSDGQLKMHGGAAGVREFVMKRQEQWRWWDNPRIARPALSMVAVAPNSSFETVSPQKGTAIRIRCAYANTTQGLPRAALAELLKLEVDGQLVKPRNIRADGPKGAANDLYHVFEMPAPAPGKHTAAATARWIETRSEVTQTIEFTC